MKFIKNSFWDSRQPETGPPNIVLIFLDDAGYTTAFFGKWHIDDQPETRPETRGFDGVSENMYSNIKWADHAEVTEEMLRFSELHKARFFD